MTRKQLDLGHNCPAWDYEWTIPKREYKECVRVSQCHCNSEEEVRRFLEALNALNG